MTLEFGPSTIDYVDGTSSEWHGAPIDGTITSRFGPRDPIQDPDSAMQTGNFHYGIDIAGPAGTPVVLGAAGRCIASLVTADTGCTVGIDHGGGIETWYYHMLADQPRQGVDPSELAPGQIIGFRGSTGLSTGNHLHFGVKLNGVWVDPLGGTLNYVADTTQEASLPIEVPPAVQLSKDDLIAQGESLLRQGAPERVWLSVFREAAAK